MLDYHRRVRARVPASRRRLHATFHAIAENQIADPATPARATCERLMAEGLNRHDAVHAVGSVIAGQVFDATKSELKPEDHYWQEMERLKASDWLNADWQ